MGDRQGGEVCQRDRRSVAAGEVIIEIGETGRSLVMVLAGSFKVMVPSGRRGRSQTMGTIQRGSVFGEVAFFDVAPRTSSVMAEERSDILVLEWSAFERLARVRPALAIEISRPAAEWVSAVQTQLRSFRGPTA